MTMPTLLEAADAFSKLGKKSLEVHEASCVRVRHRLASCDNCLRVCSHGAITIENNSLAVENAYCTGCGACASVCPTEALVLIDDATAAVFEAIDATERGGSLTITCDYLRNQEAKGKQIDKGAVRDATNPSNADEESGVGDTGIGSSTLDDTSTGSPDLSVPCLAALDESVFIHAACAGVSLSLQSAICANCPNANQDLIEDLITQSEKFVSAIDHLSERELELDVSWKQTDSQKASEQKDLSPEMSRRGMFDHLVARTTDSVAQASVGTLYATHIAHEKEPTLAQKLMAEKGVLKTAEVERNARILDDLYRFDPTLAYLSDRNVDDPVTDGLQNETDSNEEAQTPEQFIPTRLFGKIELDTESCNLCGICMTLCPTKAISGEKAEPVNSFFSPGNNTTMAGSLSFRANDCVACRLCVDICPRKSLSLRFGIKSDHLFALEPEVLLERD